DGKLLILLILENYFVEDWFGNT
ncbi:MAG: hypothetical protein RIS50_1583, partial [Bacteroidota bacterium]